MKKFSLNMYEMMEILDRLHPNAYDKLQSALEAKICEAMSEEKWLKAWDSGNWGIEMVINVEEKEEIPSIDVSKCEAKEGDEDSFSNLGS